MGTLHSPDEKIGDWMECSADEMKAIVEAAVERAIAKATTQDCLCGLNPDERREMGHLFGMMRDIGDGDRAKGIERMRRSYKVVDKLTTFGERVGVALVMFFVLSIAGGLVTLFTLGFKEFISKGGAK